VTTHTDDFHERLEWLAREAIERLACPTLKADSYGLQVWGESLKGGDTHVIDIRGWGYLTGGGHGALGLSEADGIAAQRAVQAYIVAAWNAVPALIAENRAYREALEPFAEFGSNVDEEGWTSNIHREGISVWFGPSDFRTARAALTPIQQGASS